MPADRAPVLTVMGILNIVVGSLFLLLYICGGIALIALFSGGLPFPGGVNPIDDMMAFLRRELPSYIPVAILSLILSAVMTILLIVAGIGLLNVKRWGRTLSIVYSIVTIVAQLGSVIYTLAVVNPVMRRWQDEFLQRQGGVVLQGGGASDNVLSVVGAIIGMLYAIVLLIMMLTPGVSAAFSGRRGPDYEADRFDDHDEYERRRHGDDGWGR